MKERGTGRYDTEYVNCPCFWGTSPGKFVRALLARTTPRRVLDLGAGEGKNAIFLAEQGSRIVAVECSSFAVRNFRQRLQDSVLADVRARIDIVETDVRMFDASDPFDAVIAYGLLHCLDSEAEAAELVARMKSLTLPGGYNVIVTFTPKVPPPEVQKYLEPTLIEPSQIAEWYSDWSIEEFEEDVIEETHPTTQVAHQHSVCRLIARKSVPR